MFRKLPPGPVNQLNIELNAKKCFVWLFDTLKMRTKFFLWQIIHWYTQTKHSSGLVNVGNIMETFLSKCIFMNNNFLNLNRKSLASHGECLYMERGKFAQFFQRSACNFESNIAIQSPSLTAIRLESDMKHSPYFGENFLKFIFSCTRQTIASISTVLLNYLTKYISSHHHIVPSLCSSFLTNCLKPQSNR